MVLLFLTRKIDNLDERASFVTDWLFEFAQQVEKLIIICQELGDVSGLPENVEIHSLGKEKGKNKLFQFFTFYFLLFSYLSKIDGVFAHMMPIYSVLAGPWCKIYGKKLVQWYVHKKVPLMLHLANLWVDEFVTASAESFRMRTKKKVNIFGHGIKISKLKTQLTEHKNGKYIILSVGRISPVKNIDLLVKAAEYIKLNGPELREKTLIQIIGGPALVADATYLKELEREVHEKKLDEIVDFLGPLPQSEVIPYYQNCDLFINLSETGSIDKAVLEAMASGKIVMTSNEAFKNILPPKLFLEKNDVKMLAEKIKEIYFMNESEKGELGKKMNEIVAENHNLEKLVRKIIKLF